MSSNNQQALDAGYSQEEIDSYLAKKNPKYQQAIEAGYSPEEITSFLDAKKNPKESLGANIGRQAGRSSARIAETVIGAPRAFGEFLEGLIPEEKIKNLAGKVGLKKQVEKGYEFGKKIAPYKLLPSSEDVRELNKTLFGKSVEPKNEWEQKADSLVSDFTALALPLPGSKFKLLKPALLAVGGNAASEMIGQIGGTKKQQDYAKIGTFVFGSLINPKSAENLKNDLYSKAREARPERVRTESPNLNASLNTVERNLKKGGTETWKGKIFTKIDELRDNIAGDSIEVGELEKFKTSLNNIISELYAEKNISKPGIKTAQRYVNQLGKIVDNSLKDYGKINPEWEAFYRPANEVHAAIAQSHKARNFIGKTAKKYGMHAILPALGIGHFAGGPGIAGIAGSAAVGASLITGGELAVKFANSPELRKLYSNLINSAIKQDAIAVNENLKRMDKELQESNK